MTTDAAPSWLPTLDDAAVSHVLELAGGEPDFLALPARPGVAVFEGEGGRALLIATTADLRELARRRLGPAADTADGERAATHKTDHRAVTRRVLAYEVGSALEADVVYLAQARRRMPETHRLVSERWRAWFVHVDPAAEHPRPTKTCLIGGPLFAMPARSAARDLAGEGDPGAGLLIGPVADKDAAGRLIERLTDAFDLCRDHALLVQAPRARACAYKEMGRCPAPCDGSEPLASFRLRTRRAVETLVGGLGEMRSRLAADMQAAAAAMDFELAAELKQQLARLEALSAPALAHVTDVRAWRAAVVLPTARPGRARLAVLCGGRLGVLEDFDTGAGAEALASLAARAIEAAAAGPALTPSPETLDTLAAVTRWLYTASARRRGAHVRLAPGADAAAVAGELAAAVKGLRKAREAAPALPEQAIEA